MKFFITFLFLHLFNQVQSQESDVKIYDCNTIKNGVGNINVYDTLPNGKLIGRFERLMKENDKIYEVITDENRVFFVKKSVMKKIKKTIRKNKCIGISIKRIDYLDNKLRRVIKP